MLESSFRFANETNSFHAGQNQLKGVISKHLEMRERMSNSLKNTENRFDRLLLKKRSSSTYGSTRTFNHKTNVGQESNT